MRRWRGRRREEGRVLLFQIMKVDPVGSRFLIDHKDTEQPRGMIPLLGSTSDATLDLRGNSRDLGLQVLVRAVNLDTVLDQKWAENASVDSGSSLLSDKRRGKRGCMASMKRTPR